MKKLANQSKSYNKQVFSRLFRLERNQDENFNQVLTQMHGHETETKRLNLTERQKSVRMSQEALKRKFTEYRDLYPQASSQAPASPQGEKSPKKAKKVVNFDLDR